MKCGKRTTLHWSKGGCSCQHDREEACLKSGGHDFHEKTNRLIRWTECSKCLHRKDRVLLS